MVSEIYQPLNTEFGQTPIGHLMLTKSAISAIQAQSVFETFQNLGLFTLAMLECL